MTRPINVLFCTIGANPQIMTETAWALKQRHWLPDEIHLVTTTDRNDAIWRSKLEVLFPHDKLASLFRERHPPIHLHVPARRDDTDGPGSDALTLSSSDPSLDITKLVALRDERLADGATRRYLDDIRTPEDVALMGNAIYRLLSEIKEREGVRLHVSLAGGRKTMSAQALTAFALVRGPREQASHVLILPEALEGPAAGFWHKDQGGFIRIGDRENVIELDPSGPAVTIDLVDVVVPMFGGNLRGKPSKIHDLDAALRAANVAKAVSLDKTVTLHPSSASIEVGGFRCRLPARAFATYRLLVDALRAGTAVRGSHVDSDATWLDTRFSEERLPDARLWAKRVRDYLECAERARDALDPAGRKQRGVSPTGLLKFDDLNALDPKRRAGALNELTEWLQESLQGLAGELRRIREFQEVEDQACFFPAIDSRNGVAVRARLSPHSVVVTAL